MYLKNSIVINNIKITDLKPLKKSFINKNNKFSAKGFVKNIKVKIYEVFDQNQGNLRQFVSNHYELSKFFPKLITFNKRYIIEEWVNGPTLKELEKKNIDKSNEVKNFIKLIWSINYDKEVFDYISYIHDRVKKKNNFDLKKIPMRINHNDLSLENIILTDKELKIIDNEFLGFNNGWILNIKNSFLNEDFKYQNFISEENMNILWETRMYWSKIKMSEKKMKFSFFDYFKKFLI